MKKRLMFIAAVFMTLWLVGSALAVHGGEVIIGDQVVLRIRFAAGGMTIQQRADAITVRINELLGSNPFNPEDVKVGVRNKEYVVLVRDTVIVTADQESAKFNKTPPKVLAEMWASNLRKAVQESKALREAAPKQKGLGDKEY